MSEQLRVILYGTGAMGGLMARLLDSKTDVRIVGAIDHDPEKIGRDLGLIAGIGRETGIRIGWPAASILDDVAADLVLLTTTAFAEEATPQLMEILEHKLNVVSIVQELFFPLGANVALAGQIDTKAKEKGVAVTTVGINPGFIMDIVPVVCSAPCWEVESVLGRRNVDFSPYGRDEMVHIGANLTREEFQQGAEDGSIGHIGLLESVAFVAHNLGMQIDSLHQTKEPVIAQSKRTTDFVTVEPGRVCGFRQQVLGLKSGSVLLDFEMVGLLDPMPEDGVELGDYTRITGTPNVDIRIREEISQLGGLGTAASAVNTIPRLMAATPGFHSAENLPALPRFWKSGKPPAAIKDIRYH
jgi:4-hydroxy-tetrahydrodipicolinate reductase